MSNQKHKSNNNPPRTRTGSQQIKTAKRRRDAPAANPCRRQAKPIQKHKSKDTPELVTTYWRTPQDIEFLAGLGSHTRGRILVSRPELLRRYRRAMKKRTDWGGIDPKQIREYLDTAIASGL